MDESMFPTPSSIGILEQHVSRPIACLRCRQRRSYCSKERPKCSRCREGSHECSYEDARKIVVNESYLRELESKVKAYEDTLKGSGKEALPPQTQSIATDVHITIPGPRGDYEDDFDDEHALLGPFTQLYIEQPSTSFKGPASSDNFLRSVRGLSDIRYDDWSLDQNPNFYEPGALPSRRHLEPAHVHLPPLQIARRLFQAQYTYLGTIFAFTEQASFEKELTEAYKGPPQLSDKEACLSYAKVLVILAFGQLYSVNQWIGYHGPPGFDFFMHALQLLPDAHEEGSIRCVETLALVGYFMQNMNRRDAAFLYIGMALRMAISLGLHQEVSATTASSANAIFPPNPNPVPLLDAAAREHRRRVWWSVYSLDRILSVKSGNPVTIQDEDIGVALPSKLPHESDYCPAVVLRHYTELSRILGEVSRSIYRKTNAPGQTKSGKRLMEAVQGIMLSLSRWNAEQPQELRFDAARLSISRESVSTFSHYYQCINMTARPLLFHVVQKRLAVVRSDPAEKERDWKTGLSRTTVRVIEMCISAAQGTINMMSVAAQRDLVATYGYMDGEHIFSATIVLIMVCIAFPTNAANVAAMDTGLGLLNSMAQRGNSHMGARYELLVHLRAALMPANNVASPPAMSPTSTSHAALPSLLSLSSLTTRSDPPPMAPHPADIQVAGILDPAAATTSFEEPERVLHFESNTAPPKSQDSTIDNEADREEVLPPSLSIVDSSSSTLPGEPFYDENISMDMDMDLMLWEAGFANPTTDASYDFADLAHWTYASQNPDI